MSSTAKSTKTASVDKPASRATRAKSVNALPSSDPRRKDDARQSTVSFHYIKSKLFRTIHADGVIGGATPRGLLHMSMFSERAAIPRVIVAKISGDGKIGDEVSRSGLDGIVRDMEVDLFFDVHVAKQIREWLDRNISVIEAIDKTKN